MRSLVLRIYLALVAVLLLFAAVGGWVVNRHFEAERAAVRQVMADRAAAWADIARSALPPAGAAPSAQAAALEALSTQLRVPLALEGPDGRRLAASVAFADRERLRWPDGEAPPGDRRAEREARRTVSRLPLGDGRTLLVWRAPWRLGPPGGGPWAGAGPGPGPGAAPGAAPGASAPPPPWWAWAFDPRPPGAGPRDDRIDPPFGRAEGLVALLAAVFVAVALAAWPVARRLTRRLEGLQRGVEAFGDGALHHRLPEEGRDEVSALARSFNRAAARIEALVGANRQLLANASHELRSPLARLKMAVSLLEDLPEQVPPDQVEALRAQRRKLRQEVHANIAELDAMVEEVLLASRLDAAGLRPLPDDAPVDWFRLALDEVEQARLDFERGALEGAPPASHAAGIAWSVVGPLRVGEGDDPAPAAIQVRGDERLLRRALRNLLQNARRYGGDGCEVRFEREGAQWVLSVDDRGPGVPAGLADRIFEPFFRLPGQGEGQGGVGLGLSLVRQIALRHGGQVDCQPRPGGGSRFRIALPAWPRA